MNNPNNNGGGSGRKRSRENDQAADEGRSSQQQFLPSFSSRSQQAQPQLDANNAQEQNGN